jgi:hypothetical protein
MKTKKCACGGIMHHSTNMENPGPGPAFWQCEQCGDICNASEAERILESWNPPEPTFSPGDDRDQT